MAERLLLTKSCPHHPPIDQTENAMSRRPVALLVLAITSFVLAACNSATAPQPRGDSPCSGVIGSDGRCSQ